MYILTACCSNPRSELMITGKIYRHRGRCYLSKTIALTKTTRTKSLSMIRAVKWRRKLNEKGERHQRGR